MINFKEFKWKQDRKHFEANQNLLFCSSESQAVFSTAVSEAGKCLFASLQVLQFTFSLMLRFSLSLYTHTHINARTVSYLIFPKRTGEICRVIYNNLFFPSFSPPPRLHESFSHYCVFSSEFVEGNQNPPILHHPVCAQPSTMSGVLKKNRLQRVRI